MELIKNPTFIDNKFIVSFIFNGNDTGECRLAIVDWRLATGYGRARKTFERHRFRVKPIPRTLSFRK